MSNLRIGTIIILFGIAQYLNGQKKGSFIDNRDNHSYKYIQIGQQIWMAENLAYLPQVSPPVSGVKIDEKGNNYCYVYQYSGNSTVEAMKTSFYKFYGVLYNWNMAINACPTGWHLPSDEEFFILEKKLGMNDRELNDYYYRMSGEIGYLLKSTSTWIDGGIGIDKYGFNALPGGFRHDGELSIPNPQGGFGLLGEEGIFWTSTSISGITAIRRQFSSSSKGIVRFINVKDQGYSVRCIKN